MGELESYFNLILQWAAGEYLILQFSRDSSALGAQPARFYGHRDLVMDEKQPQATV